MKTGVKMMIGRVGMNERPRSVPFKPIAIIGFTVSIPQRFVYKQIYPVIFS